MKPESNNSPTPISVDVDEGPADESPQHTPAQVAEVMALLRGEPSKKDDSSPPTDESPQKKAPLKTLDDAAERLGVKVSDLYALEVSPAQDGAKRRTLGEMKDISTREDSLAIRELKFEETKRTREADFLRAQAELEELVSTLPRDALKPEVLNAVRKRRDQHIERERALTLEAIPEWADEDTKATEVAAITEYLRGYGYPANYLATRVDHRDLKFIRDNWRRKVQVDAALNAVVEVKRPAQRSSPKSGPPPKKAAPTRTGPRGLGEKVAAVAALVGGKGE